MRFLLYSWLFLIVLLSILSDADKNSVSGQCLNDQRMLLLQLNQSFSFSSMAISVSSKLGSWNSNTDCCFWGGVNCDKDGHVIGLDLSSESISDGLDNSSSLLKLQHLQNLNLAYNSFNSKQIPSGLDRLVNLTNLNMSNSGFTGQIPIEISRLTRLVSLDLSIFSPGISPLKLDDPDLGTLIRKLSELRVLRLEGVNISAEGSKWCEALSSSLPKLQVLSLSNCRLSGPFDPSLLKLVSLYEIRLDQNNISAQVPDFFAEFSNLTSLHLSSCELNGKFPEKIFQLQKLQSLHLAENQLLHGFLPEFPQNGSLLQTLVLVNTNFSGELPNSIGNLKLLSHLELVNCGFNGSIPASMADLNQLQYLDLSSNRFIGQIPSSPTTGWSDNLIQINLAHNRLTGPIPPLWNRLVKLSSLSLKNNSLSGSIPPTLFTLPLLQKLELNQNQFTGRLADFTNNNSNKPSPLLDTLDLSSNKLEGLIPTSIFQLSSLIILTLSSNKFNGTLSLDMFQKFRNLSRLDLSGNILSIDTGGVNSALFPQVGTLNLRSCNLSVFPEFLRNQTTLNHLDLSNNQISGKIPNWVSVIGNGNLNHLNLSNNQLEDPDQPFPDQSFKSLAVVDLHSNMLQGMNIILPPSATFLDYSNNKFNSTIPPNIGSYLFLFTIFFSLSNNALVGEIPMSVCKAAYVQVIDLSNNSLSGSIPECLVSIPGLSVLNLRRNNFTGTMPQKFQGPCRLRTLDLNRNRLEGQVPRSLANCTMLEVLDLGNNQLSGTFPYWLGNLTHLRVIVLRFNKFYGSLGGGGQQTADHNHFPKLQIIDISSNSFSGNLTSECFLSWKAMMINKEEDHSKYKSKILRFGFLELSQLYYEDAVTVASKGLDMELVKILTIFTSIDLSNNGFEGEIPDVIGSLSSLYILNLSRNALTGPIPSSLGKLSQLESLDLSRNQLTGEIPRELANLSFLSFLNLSTNKLEGKIPLGTQIQSFNATSFQGNERLCGLPLTKNCSYIPEETPAFGLKSKKIDFDWQFIVTGIGFGGGVGIVFGPLLFWKRWRKWYNEQIIRLLLIILPSGLVYIACEDVRIDAEEEGMGEELMEMNNSLEEDEERCHGRFCVFCTKLDSTRRRAIHDPNCSCHLESSTSTSSSF